MSFATLKAAAALALAALTIPSALFAQENQYPQYRTNNAPAGRVAPPAPPANRQPRPVPPRPRPSGYNPHHGNRNYRPTVYIDANSYLQTPVPQEPQKMPKPKHTSRPANGPDVFDSYSTR